MSFLFSKFSYSTDDNFLRPFDVMVGIPYRVPFCSSSMVADLLELLIRYSSEVNGSEGGYEPGRGTVTLANTTVIFMRTTQ